VSNHRALLSILVLVPLTWGQQANSTNPTPVGTKAAAAPLRIDSVRRVDPENMYHRVYARVRVIGKGTPDDPRRPMFAPTQPSKDHKGILGYQMQISDDGKWALCEFVGATPQDLEVITKANDPNVVVFEQGKSSAADVIADFGNFKKNFTFFASKVRVQ